MKERIQKYIDYKNITAGELASILQVQRSNISHILNGRNKPGALLIEKLLLNFPDLNARWLLTGQGQMLEGDGSGIISGTLAHQIPHKKTESIDDEVSIEKVKAKQVKTLSVDNNAIEKIVLLYKDGTFKDFANNKNTLDD